MSVERDLQLLYQQTQEQIKQQELLLYSLYQQRTFIRAQMLEEALKQEHK
ncbi:hypothetical protein [Hydrocoleum sp. CS-953]|nr:hypothetical protein [Hydrocoleum sp. CS-953]